MVENKENILRGYPNVISYECSKKIIKQMERNICKIVIGEDSDAILQYVPEDLLAKLNPTLLAEGGRDAAILLLLWYTLKLVGA